MVLCYFLTHNPKSSISFIFIKMDMVGEDFRIKNRASFDSTIFVFCYDFVILKS